MDLDSQRAVFTIAQPNKQCWAFDFAVFVCWWDPAGVSIGKGMIYVTSQWKDVILQTLHAYECLWEAVCSLSRYLSISLSLCLSVCSCLCIHPCVLSVLSGVQALTSVNGELCCFSSCSAWCSLALSLSLARSLALSHTVWPCPDIRYAVVCHPSAPFSALL